MLKTIQYNFIYSVLAALLSFSCTNSNKEKSTKETILVFAASSLTNTLTEIVDSFEVKYNANVQLNVASSGTLARQITQGGSPDVYLSASTKWMDYIDSLAYIRQDQRKIVVKNDLVLIAPISSKLSEIHIDSSLDLSALLGADKLSMGNPAHVPAGKYAQQSLKYYGWNSVLKSNMLSAKDVRSALMVVEMGEAPMGIVYRTDAEQSLKVKILGVFPEESHSPVVYVAGMCSDDEIAKQFYTFLASETASQIWKKNGFRVNLVWQ